jgi:hypothetical protein
VLSVKGKRYLLKPDGILSPLHLLLSQPLRPLSLLLSQQTVHPLFLESRPHLHSAGCVRVTAGLGRIK